MSDPPEKRARIEEPFNFVTVDNPVEDDRVEEETECVFANDHDQRKTDWYFRESKQTKRVYLDGLGGFYFEVVSICDFAAPCDDRGAELVENNKERLHVLYGVKKNGAKKTIYMEGGCPESKTLGFYSDGAGDGLSLEEELKQAQEQEITLSGGPVLGTVAKLWGSEDKPNYFGVKIKVGADSTQLLCERVILSQVSGYLKDKLSLVLASGDDTKVSKIELPTISAETMTAVLNFVYTGECTVDNQGPAMVALKNAVDLLDISVLREKIQKAIEELAKQAKKAKQATQFDNRASICEEVVDFDSRMQDEKGDEEEVSRIVESICETMNLKGTNKHEDDAGKQFKEALEAKGIKGDRIKELLKEWTERALQVYDDTFPEFDPKEEPMWICSL